MIHSIVAQVVIPQSAELDKWILGLCITAIGILFYLLRDSYLARVTETANNSKIIVEIQQKNYELLVGLKSSIDASNKATYIINETIENLIAVLSNSQNADLRKQIKELKDLRDQQKKVGE